ncbi:hypothetical protein ACFQ1S_30790, partial [Kibdelosporangium lantanae]
MVDGVDFVVDDVGGSGGFETDTLVLDCAGAEVELVVLLDEDDELDDDFDSVVLLWVVLSVTAALADVGADDWLVP